MEVTKEILDEYLAERKAQFAEFKKVLAADSTLLLFLPTPAELRGLAALINIDGINKIDNQDAVIHRLERVEMVLIQMAALLQAHGGQERGNKVQSNLVQRKTACTSSALQKPLEATSVGGPKGAEQAPGRKRHAAWFLL